MSQTPYDAVDGNATAREGTETAELTTEERYDLLADERRRLALAALAERSTPVALTALAEAVAVREAADASPSADAVDRVAVSLHHVHLPRAADLGVIDYDSDANRIERVETVPSLSD